MHHHLPRFDYGGLTIIMSNQSRFDQPALLSGAGGYYFFSECLKDFFVRGQICIRLSEDDKPLLPGTKCVLLMGLKAMRKWTDVKPNVTLGEQRGSPLVIKGTTIPAIATYSAQDVIDVVDHEGRLNPQAKVDDISEPKDGEEGDVKRRHGITFRRNWAFWLKQDTKKACELITMYDGKIPEPTIETTYVIYPRIEEVIQLLTNEKGKSLYLDLETDGSLNITCVGFGFDLSRIYVCPLILHDYTPAYDCIPKFLLALGIAMRDNETVAYNGATFDFFVLANRYQLPIGKKVYDPMIAFHRCFPTLEKSLGHTTSMCTHEPYHKDEAEFAYGTHTQAQQLWKYCGKDVKTMILIREWIDNYAKKRPGLSDSIAQANASIRPYLISTLQGIKIDEEKRLAILKENDRYMMQYLRWIAVLIGPEFMSKLRRKSKNPLPNSNSQCCAYFHEALGYQVIMKSEKTNKPSLAKGNLYKLRIKESNPVLDVILAYRARLEVAKKLIFEQWPGGRGTCTWKIAKANTYRLASTKLLGKWGGNMQNYAKELRMIYVAD